MDQKMNSGQQSMSNFQCDKCSKSFILKRGLTRHKASEHGENEFHCKSCDRPFANKKSFATHNLRYHKNSISGKPSFKNESDTLPENSQEANIGNPTSSRTPDLTASTYDCENCNMKFQKYNLLKIHVSQFHNENLIYKCDLCDRVYASHTARTKHVKRLHTSNDTWTIECRDCNTKYPDQEAFSKHLSTKIHTKGEDLQIFCKLCHHRFYQRSNLKRHLLSNIHKNLPKADTKEFHDILYADITRNEKESEEKSTSNSEENAGKKWENTGITNQDDKNESINKEFIASNQVKQEPLQSSQTFECQSCDMKFYEENLLRMHKSQYHNENLIFVCDICDVRYASQNSLSKHVKKVHTSNQTWTYECKECDTKYPDKRSLKKHLSNKIHKKDEDLKIFCKLCDKRFSRRIHLKVHLLSGTHKKDNVPEALSKEFHDLLYIDKINIQQENKEELVAHSVENIESGTKKDQNEKNLEDQQRQSTESSKLQQDIMTNKLSPLEATVLRMDNNEKISSDEMLHMIKLICNS